MFLSSCTWLSDWPPSETSKAAAPYPEDVQEKNGWAPPPDKTGADAGSSRPETVVSEAQTGAAAHQYSRDVPNDMQARLQALENEMAMIRNDMKTMMPALTRLADVQKDMKTLLADIEPAAGHSAISPANPVQNIQDRQANPVVATNKVVSQPSTAPADYSAVVQDMRVGHHNNKVRLVMDSSAEASYRYSFDDQGKVLTVYLSDVKWTAPLQRYFDNSDLLHSYSVKQNTDGTVLTLRLRRSSDVLWSDILAATPDKPHRVVIDLSRSA